MLKGVFVEVHIIIVIIGISKKLVFYGEYVARSNIHSGQENALRLLNLHHFVAFKAEVFPLLVSQVGIHGAIADNLKRTFDPNRTVVRRDDHASSTLGDLAQNVDERRMNKP